MKLIHYDYSFRINFEDGYVNSLTVENHDEFTKLVSELLRQSEGDSGEFVLSENNAPISFSKNTELITQFIPFDGCRKTLVTKLYNHLKKEAVNESLFYETQNINSAIFSYVEKLVQNVGFAMEYTSEIDTADILKAANLSIGDSNATLAEKLIDYFLTCYELEGEKLFITVNLKPFFSDEQLKDFYDSVISQKIKLLMVENNARKQLTTEKVVIIDSDLCEIY